MHFSSPEEQIEENLSCWEKKSFWIRFLRQKTSRLRTENFAILLLKQVFSRPQAHFVEDCSFSKKLWFRMFLLRFDKKVSEMQQKKLRHQQDYHNCILYVRRKFLEVKWLNFWKQNDFKFVLGLSKRTSENKVLYRTENFLTLTYFFEAYNL